MGLVNKLRSSGSLAQFAFASDSAVSNGNVMFLTLPILIPTPLRTVEICGVIFFRNPLSLWNLSFIDDGLCPFFFICFFALLCFCQKLLLGHLCPILFKLIEPIRIGF